MSERRNEIQVGLFAIIGVLLLALLILVFGGFRGVFGDTYTVRAVFPNAAGATERTPVRLLGIEIGNVERIALVGGDGVELRLAIRRQFDIPVDAPLAIRQEGFIANIYLEFGLGTAQEDLPKDGTATVTGQVATFGAYVERATTTVSEIGERVSLRVDTIGESLLELSESVNDIVGDPLFRGDIRNIASNTSVLTAELREKLPDMAENLSIATRDARESIARSIDVLDTYRSLGADLRDTNLQVQREITRHSDNLDELQASLTQSARSVERLTDSLGAIAQAISAGQGSLGRLVSEDDLYRSIIQTIDTLARASAEFEELANTLRRHPDWLLRGAPRDRR